MAHYSQVHVHVCLKATARALPNYDFCAMVPPGGPGPAFITIPGPLNEPFEIFIRADSFTYNVLGVQGGYAIIDDIEYFGEPCSPVGDGNEVL